MRPVEVDILITGFICRSLIFIRMADCDDVSDSPLDFFIRMADCDATEQRLRILFDDIAKQFNALEYPCGNSVKVLIHIQFPITAPLMMSDISVISYMVDLLIPKGLDCEVKWGLSPREDNLCKITCAINHSKK